MGQLPEHTQGDKINPLQWSILMIEEWCVLKKYSGLDGPRMAGQLPLFRPHGASGRCLFWDNLKIPFKHHNFDCMLSWQTLDFMQLLLTYQVGPSESNDCHHPWTIHLHLCLLFEISFLLAPVILEYSFISIFPFWLPPDCCHLYKEWDEVTPSPQDSTAMI